MTDRTRIAIYGRVSTDEQQRKETIDAQLEALRRTLPGDYEVVETYLDDGISGTVSFEDRPAGRRLLKEAEAGRFEQVLAYKLDRLGRNTLDILKLAHHLRAYRANAVVYGPDSFLRHVRLHIPGLVRHRPERRCLLAHSIKRVLPHNRFPGRPLSPKAGWPPSHVSYWRPVLALRLTERMLRHPATEPPRRRLVIGGGR